MLSAIAEVLGSAVSPATLKIWAAAYGQLADIMSQGKTILYDTGAAQPGGWRKFKPFRIDRKLPDNDFATSFYLVPADGAELASFKAVQRLSVKVHPNGFAVVV